MKIKLIKIELKVRWMTFMSIPHNAQNQRNYYVLCSVVFSRLLS